MKRLGISLALSAFLIASRVGAQAFDDKPLYFQEEGKLASGLEYEVRLAESKLVPLPGEKADRVGWRGADGEFPRTAIQDFEISLRGLKVWFPPKLYRDLGEVNKVDVRDERGSLTVEIHGGDAAGSYYATFKFRENEIERVVRGGESSKSIWERTIYHDSVEDDVD